jgi:hypothetical protein
LPVWLVQPGSHLKNTEARFMAELQPDQPPPPPPPQPAEPEISGPQYTAARWSLWLPVIGILMSAFFRKCDTPSTPLAGWLTTGIWVCVVAIGFVCGILALVLAPKGRRRQILWRAIVGLSINGFILISIAAVYIPSVYRRAKVEKRRQSEALELSRHLQDAFLEYPGWVAGIELKGGGRMVISCLADESEFTEAMNSRCNEKVSWVSIEIEGIEKASVLVDPSSIQINTTEGYSERMMGDMDKLFKDDYWDRRYWIRMLNEPVLMGPSAEVKKVLAPVPLGIPPDRVATIEIWINYHTVRLPVRYMTAAEKKNARSTPSNKGE